MCGTPSCISPNSLELSGVANPLSTEKRAEAASVEEPVKGSSELLGPSVLNWETTH
jgi:hypothetical protein